MSNEAQPEATSERDAELRVGEGRISGVLSFVLGVASLGAVLCFLFPSLLTMPELRERYDVELIRWVLRAAIIAAFALGLVSCVLSKNRFFGLAGIASSLLALGLGGSEAHPRGGPESSIYLGLDYFLITLLVLAAVFVPLERAFSLNSYRIFRKGWWSDLQHFFVSHAFVQITTFLAAAPATLLLAPIVVPGLQRSVSSQPVALQVLEILLIVDFGSYWVHRAFHQIPWLWKFHAIHHSSEHMDWLASSRTHIVDALANRSIAYIPVFWLGFSLPAFAIYLTFISFHAIFIHSNLRWRFPALRWVLATPEFHHWHHTAEKEAYDKNFAVFVPALDVIFGTAYMPGHWPTKYGIEDKTVPEGYVPQLLHPFRAPKKP